MVVHKGLPKSVCQIDRFVPMIERIASCYRSSLGRCLPFGLMVGIGVSACVSESLERSNLTTTARYIRQTATPVPSASPTPRPPMDSPLN